MRKLFVLVAMALAITSCSMLKNSATHRPINVNTPFTVPVVADLEVIDSRITYAYVPSRSVQKGGYHNVLNTAIREALQVNDNADVLVGLETQIKYDVFKRVKSIVISGYPAKYKNFRNLGEDVWYENEYFQTQFDSKTKIIIQ